MPRNLRKVELVGGPKDGQFLSILRKDKQIKLTDRQGDVWYTERKDDPSKFDWTLRKK